MLFRLTRLRAVSWSARGNPGASARGMDNSPRGASGAIGCSKLPEIASENGRSRAPAPAWCTLPRMGEIYRCPGCGRLVLLDEVARWVRHDDPICMPFANAMREAGCTTRRDPCVALVPADAIPPQRRGN
jgi:hypothetical protein